MEYSSNAKGNLGVTLGAVGTGLGLLDGGASLIGKMLGGGGGSINGSPEDRPVTRYEMGLIRESMDQKIENSYLRGQLDTAAKFEGVQKQFTEQVGFNASMSANLNAVAGQTADLNRRFDRLTREFVPNENVAPGWGRANVQPAPPLPPYPYAPYGPYVPFSPFFPPQPPQTETTQSTTSSNG
jgi:hypothetical protein